VDDLCSDLDPRIAFLRSLFAVWFLGRGSEAPFHQIRVLWLPEGLDAVEIFFVGGRGHHHAAPTIWNGLPTSVTSSSTLEHFKRSLKTELYSRAFDRN